MPGKKPRNWKREYATYHGTPEQIRKRAQRNAARAAMKKRHGAEAVKGKDVAHVRAIAHGGTNDAKNLKIVSVHKNRSFKRRKDRTPA